MIRYLVVAAIAAAMTAATVPIMIWLSRRVGAIAEPNDRRVHTTPTPRLGGGAMYLGLLGGALAAFLLEDLQPVFDDSFVLLVGVIAAATLIFLVGAIDDIREVSAPAKMAGMVLAASAMAWSGLTIINLPLPYFGFTVLPPDLAFFITVMFVLVFANAVNFIDGLDGLASGVMAIASGSFLVYTVQIDQGSGITESNPGPLIAAITLGVCLGFLVWNFHPAKVFMGDSGALLLGLLMAASSVSVGGQSDQSFTGRSWFFFAPLVIPLLILGVPLVDMFFAVLRRTSRGASPTGADKDHLHHRLLRLGHGHRAAVVILWGWTALLCGFALVPAITGRARNFIPIAFLALVLTLFTGLWPTVARRQAEDLDDESLDGGAAASGEAN